ncbi:MAG: hypothetical protein J5535_06580 [Firmicutes bacterium]|nr:hypothetical protein [Bacillota bacterium]
MRSREKMKALAAVLAVASIAACVAGIFITVKGIIELVHLIASGSAVRAAVAPVVTELAEGLVLGVHYFFVSKFFIHSLKHGVPFTHEGAREILILGLESILLPILAWIVSAVAYAGIKTPLMVMGISVYEIVLGFALILASYVVDYGTEKIELGHIGHEEIRYLEKHYPDALNEARQAVAEMHLAGARDHSGDLAKEIGADPLANVTDASDYVDPESGECIQNIV